MVAKFKKFKKRQSRQSRQSILSYALLGILIIAIIGFLIFANLKINQKRSKLSSQIESLKNQIRVLEERKKELQAGISYQKSEEYLEEIAREKLNLKNPGEGVIAFVKEETEREEIKEKKKFFEKFLAPVRSLLQKGAEKLKFW